MKKENNIESILAFAEKQAKHVIENGRELIDMHVKGRPNSSSPASVEMELRALDAQAKAEGASFGLGLGERSRG